MKRRKIFTFPRETGVACKIFFFPLFALSCFRAFMKIKMQKLLPFWRRRSQPTITNTTTIFNTIQYTVERLHGKCKSHVRLQHKSVIYLRCRQFRLPQRRQRRRTNNPFPDADPHEIVVSPRLTEYYITHTWLPPPPIYNCYVQNIS